ncbi:unnamed protein product [Musa acuminata subsp. malaccensis]|uniref:(wild Malaysian banana) hypothetical protein n=1 Tax=Musa acuminata subsp. malaccensis TaxID=214687 RepID=A0A804JHP5_MUSAM|nr:PREDICTED: uncharacterized protein At3g49140-like [Musa acuminata subsp. malaccensis]CAG1846657.1 unnamed protein product [Musa acuminata subsp. malaccensis]
MLTAMDSALAIGLRPRGGACPSPLPPRSLLSLVVGACRRCSWRGKRRLFGRGFRDLERYRTNMDGCFGSCPSHPLSARVRAAQGDADSPTSNSRRRYHPSEEIEELVPPVDGEERRLTDAETARTIVEVNSKATVIFTGFIDEEVDENIIWPYVPYLTDEYGDIYFEVNNEKEILQTLISDDKLVQVIIGLDNIEMLSEMEVLGPSDLDIEVEEISSDVGDVNDGYEEDAVAIIEDELDELLSSDNVSDWTNLETMQSCHPMYFAKKMEESVSNVDLDWMDQPPASIVIQGQLRPAFAEESINIKKLPYSGELDKDQSLHNGASFYKLEMINIQIVSSYGNQFEVKIQDFREARPDVLAHSATNIISRLKSGGEKVSQALKMLCMRQKGIHVEEAVVIGVDSLGFDLRVCSGRQVQTLRFSFATQATSEFSAERQLNDILFPLLKQKQQRWQQAHQGIDS